jgi:hypothetical protein
MRPLATIPTRGWGKEGTMSCFANASIDGYYHANVMVLDGWFTVTFTTVDEWDGERIETVSHAYNLDYPTGNLTKGLNDLEEAMRKDNLIAPWFEVLHKVRQDLAR